MKGKYYRPQPVDFVLLEKMPEVGMIGGIHWKGRQARDLRNEIVGDGVDGGMVTVSFISARLRSMAIEGLVNPYGSHGGLQIWARTPKGSEQLAKRDEILGVATEEGS